MRCAAVFVWMSHVRMCYKRVAALCRRHHGPVTPQAAWLATPHLRTRPDPMFGHPTPTPPP
eukprot:1060-Chlamydomonas_euryale.AAC.1